jgi:hypothetical protein
MVITEQDKKDIDAKTEMVKISDLKQETIAYIIAKKKGLKPGISKNNDLCFINLIGDRWIRFSPCMFWYQGGPILEEDNITLEINTYAAVKEKWCAFALHSSEEGNVSTAYSNSPLRAICLAYLYNVFSNTEISMNESEVEYKDIPG